MITMRSERNSEGTCSRESIGCLQNQESLGTVTSYAEWEVEEIKGEQTVVDYSVFVFSMDALQWLLLCYR